MLMLIRSALALSAVLLAVLMLHVIVIGAFTIYHLMHS